MIEDGDAAAFKTIKMIESPKVFIKHRLDFDGQKPQFALDLIGPIGTSPEPKKPVESVVSGIGSDDSNNADPTDETPMLLARKLLN